LLPGRGESPWVLAFSPDGRRLVTGGIHGQVGVWDTAAKRCVATLTATGQIMSIACSPDGRMVAAGSIGDTEHLWELTTHKVLYTFDKRPPTPTNHPVAFSPDSRTLALSGEKDDRALVLWDVATRREMARLMGHTDDISDIVYFRDGRQVVTGCTDGTA